MDKNKLAKMIEELEVTVKEADKTIKEAFRASHFMVEPIKSQFIAELKVRRDTLDSNKLALENFKAML